MVELNGQELAEFLERNSDRLAMLYLSSDWSPLHGPMFQVAEDVEAAVGEQAVVAFIDVSKEENAALIQYLGITHVPALLFAFRHRVVDYRVGYSKVRLVNHVQQLLQNFNPFAPELPQPWHPGPFPSGIVLPPPSNDDAGEHPRSQMGEAIEPEPQFGLIPYRLQPEAPKKSWWSRLMGS